MVYKASTGSSCCPAAYMTSLSTSVHNKLDKVDRLALLASTACRAPRVSKRPFDDLCPEMVPLLVAALPLTSWYKKDLSLISSSSGSVDSDNEDDVSDSECKVLHPFHRRLIFDDDPRDTNRRILPLPEGAKQPEPVRLRERFLKSLIQPGHLPGAKARKTDEERLKFLQQDPWVDVKLIGRQRVVCNECREPVKLDSRRDAAYYPNAWLRHRRRCLGIYRAWLIENRYNDPTWIQKVERRRNARLRMILMEV
ncbi:hypothetical protein EV421DRAFT_1743682 [Armillaria borealis]|uniref:Uncharacterized protein n=1 Tax=Armillaria borealis TaxID=47425 RepID=A0AA39IVW5_9AGAR|nr:hypothetical protein EV421DRAFT_1743682 [Armillaria borealis]